MAEYIAALRKAAEFCNYGDSLSEMLWDRLVCGIMDTSVQKQFLAEKDFALDKAVSLAQSVKIAEKGQRTFSYQLKTVQNFTNSLREPVQEVRASQGKQSTKTPFCFCCCGQHLATKCRFISEECYSCRNKAT